MVTRSALPQNYQVTAPTLLDDFEVVGDWTRTAGDNHVADTTYFKTGSAAIRLGSGTNINKTVNFSLGGYPKILHLWVYRHNTMATSVTVNLSNNANYANFFRRIISSAETSRFGWNHCVVNPADWTVGGGSPSWNNPIVKLNILVQAGADVTIDSMYFGGEYRPQIVLCFDDAYESTYTIAKPTLDTYGITGTTFVVRDLVGTTDYCSLAQLQELYAAGWCVANHTTDHTGLVSLSRSQAAAKISACSDYLIVNGMSRGAYYFAYPGGQYNADIIGACEDTSIKSARTTISAPQAAPIESPLEVSWQQVALATSLASAKILVDRVKASGTTAFLTFHQILDSPVGAADWATSDFQVLMAHIADSKISCMTYDEWYNGLTNPRYRSLPVTRATA